MKRSVYFLGIACANLMLAGSLFKVFHWPGANVLLVLAVALFALVFLPVALYNSYREQQRYRTLYIVTFLVFASGMLSVLFKVLHWPGANIIMTLSLPLPFLLFLPVYLYHTRKEKKYGTGFQGIMFGLVFLAVFSVLLAF